MEMEYSDPSRRGRWIILVGIILAVVTAAAAFYLITTAQQGAGRTGLQTTTAVVAAKPLSAKKTLTADDLTVRTDVPLDATTSIPGMVATSEDQLIGRVVGVDVAQGQLMTINLLASTSVGGQFPILGPGETVGPDSDAWRAVSITVADDRAVGGMLAAGMVVDVLMSEGIKVPGSEPPTASGSPRAPTAPEPSRSAGPTDTSGLSTKVTYQKMQILARQGSFYILKATLPVAEEITQASLDGAVFTLLMRPDQDARIVDVSGLGATTSRILQRYGLLVPQTWPVPGQLRSEPPIPAITPPPSSAPSGSPAPSAAP